MKNYFTKLLIILAGFLPVAAVFAQTSVPWGSVPTGWDDFKVGLVNDNSNIINVRMKKALSEGVKLHYRYAYVNNGVDPNSNALSWLFNQWGTDYSKNSTEMGLRPSYVIYMLQEEGGAAALKANILNQDFMRKYFTSIRTVCEKSNGYKAIFVIEPDTWGYFLQNALEQNTESNPNNIPANVNNLGAGYEYLSDLPNTLSGVAKGIIRTIRRYAPDAYCGHLMSFWAVSANGATGPPVSDGAKGMVYWNQSDVDYSANRTGDFAIQLLGTSGDRGDFIGVEKNGWSAGNWLVKQNRDDYYWNDVQNGKWISWSKTMAQKINLPLLGWQISIGHMGLPNTVNRYEDTFMPYFFTHTQEFIQAGFIGFLAGKGLADCTDFTNKNGNELEADGSAGDDGWFFERLKEFDAGRPYLGTSTNSPPTVAISSPSNNSTFTAPATITITASASDVDGSVTQVAFYNGSNLLGTDNSSPYSFTLSGVGAGTYTITAKATDDGGAITTSSAVTVVVGSGNTNLALNKAVTTSSTENSTFPGSKAVDGNGSTRWSSAFSDPQWMYVDLGASYNVNRVKISWEAAYGKNYQVEISTNASTWTTLKSVSGNTSLVNDHTGLSGFGRYIRIYGTARGTVYGYSIYELEVYGTTTSNNPPTVSITSPSNNSTFTPPATITISANATDQDGTISKVEFFNGTIKLGEDTSSPYSFSWANVQSGNYSLSAIATDDKGATGKSSSVVVTVVTSCDVPPSVIITSPSNNSSYTAPASVTINANANACEGVSKVEFYNGSTLLGSDATSPYSFSWNNIQSGSYCVTAKLVSSNNNVTTSSPICFNVVSCSNSPTVSIISPVNGASFTSPASISISANASGTCGTITKVEFYSGATLLNSDNTSPYSYTWSNVAAGNYTLTAKVTDSQGLTSTSPAVSVTVTGGGELCTGKPQYVENGGYVAGSQVVNVGNLYECKPYPYSGWCNGAAWAYAPGTGSYWSDAWILKGSCTSGARVGDQQSALDLSIYPNPATDGKTLHIDLDDLYKDVKIIIQSLNGGKTNTYRFKNIKRIELTLPESPKGVNVIQVEADKRMFSRKLIF